MSREAVTTSSFRELSPGAAIIFHNLLELQEPLDDSKRSAIQGILIDDLSGRNLSNECMTNLVSGKLQHAKILDTLGIFFFSIVEISSS